MEGRRGIKLFWRLSDAAITIKSTAPGTSRIVVHLLGSSYLMSNLWSIHDLSNVYLWSIEVLMAHLGVMKHNQMMRKKIRYASRCCIKFLLNALRRAV